MLWLGITASKFHQWRRRYGEVNCRRVALDDADLQRVVSAWAGVPAAIKRAAVGLICQCISVAQPVHTT